MIEDLIRKNRTCRRFYENHEMDLDTLTGLVNLARLSASAANLQPLKYIVSCGRKKNEDIFACLGWAGYLKDWPGPEKGERPSGYVIILADTRIAKKIDCDHGIAAQSIILGAREIGLAGCMIGNIKRKRLSEGLNIAEHFKIMMVIALGKPKEKIVVESMEADDDVAYWRDEKCIHHVPKRQLNDIIVASYD